MHGTEQYMVGETMAEKTEKKEETVFTKEQIIHSNRFKAYRDFLTGNLKNNETYTLAQVEQMIEKYYGKGKSEKECH